MAKKKTTRKGPGKAPKGRYLAVKGKPDPTLRTKGGTPARSSAQRSGRKPSGPRSQALPLPGGLGKRIQALDDCAAALADIRDQMAELRADEAGQKRTALSLMRSHNKTAWRHAGVEMARVPGEEKLRVRKSKEQATAVVDEELPTDARGETAGASSPEAEGQGEGVSEEQQLEGAEDADDQGLDLGVH